MQRLIKIGDVAAKNSSEIKYSRCGIGMEKLDRNIFDPEKAYDKIAATGVKWVRIQSGWERTEREKGVYNFEWLDSIVDNLLKRGLKPWMCLCYGNGLYGGQAAEVFGGVGCPPIFTDEQRTAWTNYVRATVSRYRGKVDYFEVWNEPDGIWCWKHGVNARELASFTVESAKAIKEANSEASVLGGSLCLRDVNYLNLLLKNGGAECIDALTYHEYTHDETVLFERVRSIRALLDMYNPKIRIIQGESGSQSRFGGRGALKDGNWTPLKQAKQLARHSMADLMTEVEFFSYFSSVDMAEATRGVVGDLSTIKDYGYFGILNAGFNEDGRSDGEYTPKMSYRTLQTIASMFSEDCRKAEIPVLFRARGVNGYSCEEDVKWAKTVNGAFKRGNGSFALVYWHPSNIMTTDYEATTTIQIAGVKDKEVRLVNILDGSVYALPEGMIQNDDEDGDCKTFLQLPITDYPLALTFGDFCETV